MFMLFGEKWSCKLNTYSSNTQEFKNDPADWTRGASCWEASLASSLPLSRESGTVSPTGRGQSGQWSSLSFQESKCMLLSYLQNSWSGWARVGRALGMSIQQIPGWFWCMQAPGVRPQHQWQRMRNTGGFVNWGQREEGPKSRALFLLSHLREKNILRKRFSSYPAPSHLPTVSFFPSVVSVTWVRDPKRWKESSGSKRSVSF